MIIEDKSNEQNVTVSIELLLLLDQDTFEKVYVNRKAHYELSLYRAKEVIAQIFEFIKEIGDAFPEIKFDALRCCFYNESEELAQWSAAKGKRNGKAGEDKGSFRSRCDCCVVL